MNINAIIEAIAGLLLTGGMLYILIRAIKMQSRTRKSPVWTEKDGEKILRCYVEKLPKDWSKYGIGGWITIGENAMKGGPLTGFAATLPYSAIRGMLGISSSDHYVTVSFDMDEAQLTRGSIYTKPLRLHHTHYLALKEVLHEKGIAVQEQQRA